MNTDNEAEPDVPTEDPKAGMPLMVVKQDSPAVTAPATPQQMRVMEVNEALAPAYAKASMLELTDHEIAALTAPFPDNMVEVRPHDGLIYIPHIHISNRLNEVIKPGKWSLICRRHWLEGGTMYGEYILLIRGAYVGESVGGHPYQPNNPKTNYSDSLESTAGEALRRICGKRLSCGSQVWDPSYANQWCMKYRFQANGKYYKKMDPTKPSATIPTQTVPAKPKATPPPSPPVKKPQPENHSDEYKKEKARKFAKLLENVKEMATQFCIELGWILPTEGLESVSYTHLPKTEGQFKNFKDCLEAWAKDGAVKDPYGAPAPASKPAEKEPEDPDDDESDAASEPWYNVIIPVPHKGEKRDEYLKHPETIGQLYELRHDDEEARKRLFGFVNHFEPKGWTGKDGKTHPPSQSDIKFRESLDQFQEFFEKTHPEEKL